MTTDVDVMNEIHSVRDNVTALKAELDAYRAQQAPQPDYAAILAALREIQTLLGITPVDTANPIP